ncbi:FG-GAP repeat domain-containing protein [Streptomyces sp. HPF1205]|uniref:FG-GAP repeat domain-containing protein n=1 Tax=Streptomyces sp. HPF1205 TaxID=2873262 RepID=UPI0035ABFA6A
MVARDKSGVLWRYLSDGHGHLAARRRIGGGWNVYNALVGVGDLNNDGLNDLVARDKNGDLWRYSGLADGLFAPRVRIGRGWQTYKALL